MPLERSRRKAVAPGFDRSLLDRTVVAIPLLRAIEDVQKAEEWMDAHGSSELKSFNAVVFLARDYPEGRTGALEQIEELLAEILIDLGLSAENRILQRAPRARDKRLFVVARLERKARLALLDRDRREEFRAIDRIRPTHFEVIIDLNLSYPLGRSKAREWLFMKLEEILPPPDDGTDALLKEKGDGGGQYVFARMCWQHIETLLHEDEVHANQVAKELGESPGACRTIHSIWPDFAIKPCITSSISTIKADAALSCFSTLGSGITWAVIDSGIQADHPHFRLHNNINAKSPLHRDFTPGATNLSALTDKFGHGTHVAGIIAGEFDSSEPGKDKEILKPLTAVRRVRVKPDAQESAVRKDRIPIERIRGMAPECELISLKVLDDVGFGEVSNVIAALSWILDLNNSGRAELKIHGVNISLGYELEPEWFGCGASPICVEVDRVVRSGVSVVVAAGNTGYGTVASRERASGAGLDITINDPGNAELAITVGATHRDMPHRYGVSFFSSKGPTGDGRPKPDLVAPGEKILSCATGSLLKERAGEEARDFNDPDGVHYVEDSGTSMAAPHVSGIVAGFLSVRREFVGKPERVKEIFCATATDLKRDRYFQGAGLADLMRAIQSV